MAGAQRRMTASQDSSSGNKYSARTSPPALRDRRNRGGRGAAQEELATGMPSAKYLYILILSTLLALAGLFWFFTRTSLPPQPASGTSNSSVYERGLVTTDLSYQSVLSDHSQYWSNVSHRHFKSTVLGYVTPWNGKGYDMAKIFRAKFSHISPVWYQLKRSNEGLNLHGRHDVDEQWIKDVRKEGSPLIVPRVVLEGWPLDILVKKEERQKAVLMLADEIIEMELDGIVLEAWSVWRAHRILEDPDLRRKALEFVKVLGLELHAMTGSHLYIGGSPQLIFVIPPPGNPRDPTSFSTSDMIYLRDAVDGFSLMTYDYSSPYSPGPNAPLKWVQQCLRLLLPSGSKAQASKMDQGQELRSFKSPGKMLMGINFYGNDYSIPKGGGPILGLEYILLIGQHKPRIIWDEASQEHYFEYRTEGLKKTRNLVYYPSLKSVSLRLREAESWGVGISIWEIGQGLDYFFDLL